VCLALNLSKGQHNNIHAQENINLFFNIFLLLLTHTIYRFVQQFRNMAKIKKSGRPKGSEKEPMNIYINKGRAQKLRELATEEQKTISIMVENALETSYGI
jgi:hypothetical protein